MPAWLVAGVIRDAAIKNRTDNKINWERFMSLSDLISVRFKRVFSEFIKRTDPLTVVNLQPVGTVLSLVMLLVLKASIGLYMVGKSDRAKCPGLKKCLIFMPWT